MLVLGIGTGRLSTERSPCHLELGELNHFFCSAFFFLGGGGWLVFYSLCFFFGGVGWILSNHG